MTNATTMVAFIQRFLSAENSSRKRKRGPNPGFFSSETPSGLMSTSNEEIDDLRKTIEEHSEVLYSSTADRERSISEFLALADERKPDAKRRKKDQGRLSIIEESEEHEGVRMSETKDDVEIDMVEVDLSAMGLDVPVRAIHTDMNSHDEMVVDRDMWTWKGGNGFKT